MLSQGGITAIDLSPANEDIIASAGRDHTVQIYDRSAWHLHCCLHCCLRHEQQISAHPQATFLTEQHAALVALVKMSMIKWLDSCQKSDVRHTLSLGLSVSAFGQGAGLGGQGRGSRGECA